jgi:Haem-NO-binding
MHGLIFATWERFLSEQYGEVILGVYKAAIEGTSASVPLASRVYDDAILYRGVAAVSTMTGTDASVYLREYGRYFVTNKFTNHLCGHIFASVHSARDLLLAMRGIHKQLHAISSDIIPPIFSYSPLQGNDIRISYDSHRQLCPLLWGAIDGAGLLYQEYIAVREVACMRKGDSECKLDVHFLGKNTETPPMDAGERYSPEQQKMREILFHTLPDHGRGLTLYEVSALVARTYGFTIRPSRVAGLIMQMQNVGLVILSAKQAGDMYYEREYLKVSKCETEAGRLLVINVS